MLHAAVSGLPNVPKLVQALAAPHEPSAQHLEEIEDDRASIAPGDDLEVIAPPKGACNIG